MLNIKKRKFYDDTIEELKERKERQKERFYKRWERYNNINYDYLELTPNILIQCQQVYIENVPFFKETFIYNINKKEVIKIEGIATTDFYKIPIDINCYNK